MEGVDNSNIACIPKSNRLGGSTIQKAYSTYQGDQYLFDLLTPQLVTPRGIPEKYYGIYCSDITTLVNQLK